MKTEPNFDILKIDTEGHEHACLKGLFKGEKQAQAQHIQLEMHNDDMYLNAPSFENITALLTEQGYALEAKIKHGFGDFDEMIFKRKNA